MDEISPVIVHIISWGMTSASAKYTKQNLLGGGGVQRVGKVKASLLKDK